MSQQMRSICFIRWGLTISAMLLFFSCQPSCVRTDSAPAQEAEKKAGAALVNGVTISLTELDTLHKRAVEQFAKTNRPVNADLDRQLRGSILRKLIDDEILKQKAVAEGVKVDRLERVEALEKYKEKFGGQRGLELFLNHQNLTEEQFLKTLEAEVQRDKIIKKIGGSVEPTEEEIKTFYMKNQRIYTVPESVHARHILLKFSSTDPKEKEAAVLEKAKQILKEASEPNVTFESLVQKYSDGPSVKTGGDLGTFPRGRMVKEFDDVAFNAPLKKAVGPVKTEYGYHIVYVEERTPVKVAELAEVRDRVIESIKHGKTAREGEQLLTSWRTEAKVKILDHSMTQEEYEALSVRNATPEKQAKKEP